VKLNFPGRVLLTLCVLMQVGCAAEVVLSRWGKSDIVVDGMENEWEGPPQYYEKEKQMVVRVANDAKSLYLCLSTRNKPLEIWLRVKMADSMIGAESIPAKRISDQ
jgi:hypothetical protein